MNRVPLSFDDLASIIQSWSGQAVKYSFTDASPVGALGFRRGTLEARGMDGARHLFNVALPDPSPTELPGGFVLDPAEMPDGGWLLPDGHTVAWNSQDTF